MFKDIILYFKDISHRKDSKWDIKEPELPVKKSILDMEKTSNAKTSLTQDYQEIKKIHTCQPANYYTIKDGQIVKLRSNTPSASGEYDLENIKLSEDEISNLPKFKNYEKGTPSKVISETFLICDL